MIKAVLVCLMTLVLVASCNKKSSDSTTVVEYQVQTTNSSKIDISYNNVIGTKTQASAIEGWAFDITNPAKPYTAYIQAISTSPFSSITTTCTVNILVNGSLVKTTTASSTSSATAEAEYVVQ